MMSFDEEGGSFHFFALYQGALYNTTACSSSMLSCNRLQFDLHKPEYAAGAAAVVKGVEN